MKNSLSKLHYLLFALFMFAMTGCGANNTAGTAGTGTPGSLTAKLVWGASKTAKTLAATVPTEVKSVQFTVTGTGANGPIPVVRATVSTTGGQIGGIYPGNVTVAAKALDANGNAIYEGYVLNVAVTAGAATDAGTISMTPPITKAQDKGCVDCHETMLDNSGQNLVADFKQSGHYSNSSWTANAKFGVTGTGCAGCHGPSHNTPDPSAAGRCFECHASVLNPVHFNNYTGKGAHAAMYVATGYQSNCSACHEPHNPLNGAGKEERAAWAESAHGDVNGAAWATEDMQATSQTACQRCHTATGFKNFVAGGYAIQSASNFGSTDKAREVLACDACHSDDGFAVRKAGAFVAPYNNGLSSKTLPDAGESNLCNACHTGRESGDTINAVTNFTNVSFKNSHYLAASGLMYMSTGFTNFTTGSAVLGTTTYAKTLTPDNTTVPSYGISGGVSSTHRKLGTTLIRGDSHNTAVFIAGQFDANGPCVTCHMNAYNAPSGTRAAHGHTLEIDANAYNQVCKNCHTSEGGVPLTGANFQQIFLEPQSEVFQNALSMAISLLQSKAGIKYDGSAYPYFYDLTLDPTGKTAVKDWTRGRGNNAAGNAFGKKMMGAAFNINLLKRDPAAYVHARSYARRLIYDTIDFLDDGAINLSVGATAIAYNPTLYGKGATAYTDGTLTTLASGTTESMIYILGWSRTNGAWNSPERP